MNITQGTMSLADGYVLVVSIILGFALTAGAFAWLQNRRETTAKRRKP